MKKKIMLVIGTRPEATKMVPVIQALHKRTDWFETKLVVTGQHKEQMEQSLSPFNIIPDIDLNIMKQNQSLAYVTTSAISGLDELMIEDRPDFVLVHGDTQASFCGATTAFFHKIPVGHIESGLRSHNKYSPFPEEVNRRLVDVIADLHFAPTWINKKNLLSEGYSEDTIHITGQTGVDLTMISHDDDYKFINSAYDRIFDHKGRLLTMTAHRRENLGQGMVQMFRAIRRLVDDHEDVLLVYPVHLSPRVRETAFKILSDHDRILLTEPAGYTDMINLMSRSYMVLSDSGGLQEETVVFNKPLILMRDTTERPEALEGGSAFLSGTDEETIYKKGYELLNDEGEYQRMAKAKNPFGDGQASDRIVKIIAKHFGLYNEKIEGFKA